MHVRVGGNSSAASAVPRHRPRRHFSAFAMMSIFVLVLAGACTGGADSLDGAGGSGDETATIKVGALPIAACAPLYLGVEKGFFEAEGIRVEAELAPTGAAILPAINAGELQFGFSSVPALMQAATQGLPIKIVAQGSQAGPGESSHFEGVLVKQDGSIQTPEDLEGATVAVNSIESIGPLLINAALAELGVDSSKVNYTEISFSEANIALDQDRVDAVYQTEPFLTQAQRGGEVRVLMYHYEEVAPQVTIATYFTTGEFAEQNPDLVARFQKAMNRSLRYASEHPEEARATVLTFTEIPEDLAKTMVLPGWDTELDPGKNGLNIVADLAVAEGSVDKRPDLQEMIVR